MDINEIRAKLGQIVRIEGWPAWERFWPELEPVVRAGLAHLEGCQVGPLDQVVTMAEAVEVTGLSQPTLFRMASRGEVPARRTDQGIWLILRAGLPVSDRR